MKSESGILHAALVQKSIHQFWERRLPFVGIESNIHYLARCPHAYYEEGQNQWGQLIRFLKDEGVQVFEVISILKNLLEKASLEERRQIIMEVWKGSPFAPKAEELNVDHLTVGHPPKPFYDKKTERVILPDFQRVSWPYPRDTSFTTPNGTIICKMRRFSRRYEPRVLKLVFEYHPKLKEKTEIIWDANKTCEGYTEPPCIEGGDVHIIDEETVAIGIGQRTTFTGFRNTAKKIFETDNDNVIKNICAVKLPSFPAVDYMHLDVVINYPDHRKALVMPYTFDTEILCDMPPKKLLLKTLEAIRSQSDMHQRPMRFVVHHKVFGDAGTCFIYGKGKNNPKFICKEVSLIDFLVKEEKIDADEIILVGGTPKSDFDMDHMMNALMEQARGASNIVTIKPGLVIAYKRNRKTNDELKKYGIKVKEWEDSYLDMLGGPHCSISPLCRDGN